MTKHQARFINFQKTLAIRKGVLSISGCQDYLILGAAERTPASSSTSFLSPRLTDAYNQILVSLVLQGLSAKELGLPPCFFGHTEVLQIFAPLCK